jgi:alpha-ketoglutarate-dependent taurine dioxygenase
MDMDALKDTTGSSSVPASVKTQYLPGREGFPLLVSPADGVDLIAWTMEHREFVETSLAKHGALLFRGFNLRQAEEFERFIKALSGELIEYRERSSPRHTVKGRIYTSTDHPAKQSIFPHNEQSYNSTFPMKISFFCHTPALQGGDTPIGDTRKVFQRLDPRLREQFIQKKYMYVRNYGNGLGLSWEDVFQTSDKALVEDYCRKSNIEYEWKTDGLRTRQVRDAVARHPRTGEWVWFNHATFFHVSMLEPGLRDALLEIFDEEDLPNNTYYGDGSPIEPWVLDELRAAYQAELVSFTWRLGDILLLDNMLTSHARQPFQGPRKIFTAMSELRGWHTLAPFGIG